MNVQLIQNTKTAEIISERVVLHTVDDAVDILGNAHYHGADSVILKKEQIVPNFFDLKTGIAGDVLQKFSNYNMKLTIIGDFSHIKSKSLKDFIFESNKTGQIRFTASRSEAIEKLKT